jgi:alpha-N-arabinofuranosidase
MRSAHWFSRAAVLFAALAAPAVAVSAHSRAKFDWFRYSGREPRGAAGAGEYHNPILQGFYPDPSITRVGSDYYLVNSTFAYFPGIPVFHSRDLVNWTQIGNAIDRAGQFDFTGLGVSEGMFAPAISERSGKWYIVDVCVGCGGSFIITADNPRGPWSRPIFIHGLAGAIDPSLAFDREGQAWIVYNGPPPGAPLYDGHRAIWIQNFDPATGRAGGRPILLVNGGIHPEQRPIWIEGPHIFFHGGFYFLVAAEGGTGENHSEVVLRSRSITGPYVAGPVNPILTQRDLPPERPAPVTSAGHASLVETAAGEWWAVFLATRPYADDLYNTGRETFLLPVTWRDGWPDILSPGRPVPIVHLKPDLPAGPPARVPTSGSFAVTDGFAGRRLPPYWMMLRTPSERWYRLAGGALELRPRRESLSGRGNPSFLARRQQHAIASASTMMRYVPATNGDKAGLVAFQNEDHWYFLGLTRAGGRLLVTLDRRAGTADPGEGNRIATRRFTGQPGAPLYLRISAHGGSYDFYYGYAPNAWRPLLLGGDGTILSTKKAGGFVGASFGLYAYGASGGGR